MTKRTWTCKDSAGCEFIATVLIDSDDYTVDTDKAYCQPGQRRYSAFGGKVTASTLNELKDKVASL